MTWPGRGSRRRSDYAPCPQITDYSGGSIPRKITHLMGYKHKNYICSMVTWTSPACVCEFCAACPDLNPDLLPWSCPTGHAGSVRCSTEGSGLAHLPASAPRLSDPVLGSVRGPGGSPNGRLELSLPVSTALTRNKCKPMILKHLLSIRSPRPTRKYIFFTKGA